MTAISSRRVVAVCAGALLFGATLGGVADADMGQHRPKTMVPKPSPARSGCHLSAELYDASKNQTTFSYDCDGPIDAAGHRSYTETKPGNYFASHR